MTNAVWLFMYWDGASIADAKDLVRVTIRKYKRQFEHLREQSEGTLSHKFRKISARTSIPSKRERDLELG